MKLFKNAVRPSFRHLGIASMLMACGSCGWGRVSSSTVFSQTFEWKANEQSTGRGPSWWPGTRCLSQHWTADSLSSATVRNGRSRGAAALFFCWINEHLNVHLYVCFYLFPNPSLREASRAENLKQQLCYSAANIFFYHTGFERSY